MKNKVCETINRKTVKPGCEHVSHPVKEKEKKNSYSKRKIVHFPCAHPLVIRYGCPVRLFVRARE